VENDERSSSSYLKGKIGVETAAELIAVYYQKKTGGRENA
jgi:hypothetical protein